MFPISKKDKIPTNTVESGTLRFIPHKRLRHQPIRLCIPYPLITERQSCFRSDYYIDIWLSRCPWTVSSYFFGNLTVFKWFYPFSDMIRKIHSCPSNKWYSSTNIRHSTRCNFVHLFPSFWSNAMNGSWPKKGKHSFERLTISLSRSQDRALSCEHLDAVTHGLLGFLDWRDSIAILLEG